MTEPYLILHKVRGEPAFDIAIQMECPICKDRWEHEDWICGECNGDKYWWIIPTSGHRAYPYWSVTIDYDHMGYLYIEGSCISHEIPELPEDIPDHYQYSIDPFLLLAAGHNIASINWHFWITPVEAVIRARTLHTTSPSLNPGSFRQNSIGLSSE